MSGIVLVERFLLQLLCLNVVGLRLVLGLLLLMVVMDEGRIGQIFLLRLVEDLIGVEC